MLALDFFPLGYAWEDPQFGELKAVTVVPACDGETAVKHLLSKQPHLTRAWVLADGHQPQPEDPFVTARAFLKKDQAV